MKQYYLRVLLLSVLSFAGTTETFAQFTLQGEVRPRAEFRNGFKSPNTLATDPAFFVEQRSRLYAGYKAEKMAFRLTLQDVRIWGGANQIYKNDDPALFNVYEAWGEYFFTPQFSVRAGRQALDYDNARFLGDLDWAQQGRSHDAALFLYKAPSGFQAHFGAAYNQSVAFEPGKLSGTYYDLANARAGGNYKTMQYLWLHQENDVMKASLLVHNDGRQTLDTSGVNFRQTYGLYAERKLGGLNLTGELYYQGGKNAGGQTISAYLAAFDATFKTALTPLTVGVDYLSGTDATDTKDRAFNPLYGTNHKFYGFMDYFYVGNGHQNKGLADFYVKTKFKLGKKAVLLGQLHQFNAAATVTRPAGDGSLEELSSSLGQEIDLVFNLALTEGVSLQGGYSQLFSSASMDALKGTTSAGGNQWAWLMFTIKPTLFSSAH
ncbi:Alginate export [Catalinimonas alkaloidigena]|uniref:Alginate export n=1 Tax=Catalinimonas alkaloidigena TaxID=1075417 RepID=A0A1G9R5W3_9BACT|nr:alginate export family protein [Catalinimonas alkaloidigena]SDM18634.1 Alginate export [Catalinimonas alkaloidigena]